MTNLLGLQPNAVPLSPEYWVAEDTVVSRNDDGTPLSLFRDDVWDLRPYAKNLSSTNLYFRDLVEPNVSETLGLVSKIQAKQLVYSIINDTEDRLAVSTIQGRLGELRKLSRAGSRVGKSLFEALQDVDLLVNHLRALPRWAVREVELNLKHIHRYGTRKWGVAVPLRKLHPVLVEVHESAKDPNQHPVIPTRIYSQFLANIERELAFLEGVSDALVEVMRWHYAGRLTPLEPTASLQKLFEHFGRNLTPDSLSGLATEIGVLCEIIVIAFTGMRAHEAQDLPYNCLRIFKQDGVDHFVVEGITTKFNGGRPKRACWVTSHLGVRAIRLAQKIFGVAHEMLGQGDHLESSDGKFRLFCRTGIHTSGAYAHFRSLTPQYSHTQRLIARVVPSIAASDIEELKVVTPFRAWDEEPEFAVGTIWPFTRHQLRRSLALYAQRSGLVTLPTLKRQLNHITQEMSTYYARGSAFAKNILGTDKDHFVTEWRDAQGMSQYLAYAQQVLFSDEELFGGHAAWARSKPVQQSPVSVYKREQTIAMFERGELAYKENALGGCTSTEICSSNPLQWLPAACLESNCKNLVLSPSKLKRTITAQERRVNVLAAVAPNSVEARIEKETLDILRAAESRLPTSEESST